MLVDTGLPGSERKIGRALRAHGLDWSDVALTILTHAHIDHAGAGARVRKLSKAPVFMHQHDLPYCEGHAPVLRPTGGFGRLFQKTGAIERPFTYFTPDQVVQSDDVALHAYGFSARIIATPGHTPGSQSVLFENGDVIAGDLAASGILLGGIMLRGRPKQPPFEEDTSQVIAALEHLLLLGATRFFLGHGGPLDAHAIAAHVAALKRA